MTHIQRSSRATQGMRYVTTHHSFVSGWGFSVVACDLAGGAVSDSHTVAAGNCFVTRDKALEAGKAALAGIEEEERLAGDLLQSTTKFERGDQAALEQQVHMLRCRGAL
jgi:hypothetical protein